MWELVKSGGIMMIPIVVLSILALMLIIERSIRLRRMFVITDNLGAQIIQQAHQGTLPSIPAPALQTSLGRVLQAGIQHAAGGLEYASMQLQTAASQEIHLLEKNLNHLNIIGTVAPLIGLLGSVFGIITAFSFVNMGNNSDPAYLMSGIAQALICTAGGMVVAIPALIAHRLFQNKILDYSVEMEKQAGQLLQAFFGYAALNKKA